MFGRLISTSALAAAFLLPVLAIAPASAASPEMEALIKAAQKEGKVEVILGGQMPQKLRKAMPAFEEKYGIKVNFQTGSSRKHSARILAERENGIYSIDAWIGGGSTALSILYPNKVLAPLDTWMVAPEVKDPKNWYQGKHHFQDPEGRYVFTWGASPAYVIAINTDKVNPDEIQSYWDLLDPKWKGKIVARSPARHGSGASSAPMMVNPGIGEEWFRRLANEMDMTIVKDSRQGAEWLGIGRFSIALFGINTPSLELQKQGFPVLPYLPQVLKEGEILSASAANIMGIDKPANPNAAKLFINWALSQEGQQLFIKIGEATDSLRTDVDNSVIEEQYRIKPDRDYHVAFSDPKIINGQKKIMKKIKKIMQDAGYN